MTALNLVPGHRSGVSQNWVARDSHTSLNHEHIDTQFERVEGTPLTGDQLDHVSQNDHVSGTHFPHSEAQPKPIEATGGDTNLQGAKFDAETNRPTHPAPQLASSQHPDVTHAQRAAGTTLPETEYRARTKKRSSRDTTSPSQELDGTQYKAAGGNLLFDPYLYLLSATFDDLEKIRIATENRVRQLTRTEVDSDGEIRGFGLDSRAPEVLAQMQLLDELKQTEHEAELNLKRQIRKHPLAGWIKTQKGVGEKQAARLLAVLGDPYWNTLHDRPRTVSELWAYCGYSVAQPR